jgi:site-specific DNA-cytosine methylase
MKKEFLDYINNLFGVEPIFINSSLVSAQNRQRYYWTNIGKIEQPEDKNIYVSSILEHNCTNVNSESWHRWWKDKKEFQLKKKYSAIYNNGSVGKAITMVARQYANWNGNLVEVGEDTYRNFTPRECMRLQTIPEYIIDKLLNAGISKSQLYKMTGNGWTVDVIVHILSYLEEENQNET